MVVKKPRGSNITLMNTVYFREKVMTISGKTKFVEHLDIIYKDCDTGKKHKEEIINPDYRYYTLKPDKVQPYAQFFVPQADVDECYTPNNELLKTIAEQTGNLEYFYNNIQSGNRRENDRLHTHPAILGSDRQIEDHYRERFNEEFINQPCGITKSFMDIEVDTKRINYDFPESGKEPINAVSLILQDEKKIYSLLLRNPENPLIAEFEQQVQDGSIYPELNAFIINAIGGPEAAEKYDLQNISVTFMFYNPEDEIHLIADLFKIINTKQPDFLLAWNMAFDMVYIINRIKELGYDPADIISHKDFGCKHCEYRVDESVEKFNELAERGDYACITSYTVYLDQMIHFASRRKGGEKFLNYKLDYIGEKVAKVRKLDYKHITQTLGELPYLDFKTFVFYNIMDTIVQYCIEFNTEDIEYVFTKSNLNNVRYNKCHRQTVYLTNRASKEFKSQGFIMGNNLNRFNPKPTEKFPGAFVADPLLLDNILCIYINGSPVMVYNNLMDFDKRIVA